jgi:ATP-dependent Clp protease ATP-binding subunit ClpA
MFTPLTNENITKIVGSTEKRDKMLALQGITMDASRSYCYLADKGYDPQFGPDR